MPTVTPQIQKHLNDETDARFWAQGNGNPGQKLDPKNPADAALIPKWAALHTLVVAQYNNGTIKWTAPINDEVNARFWAQTNYRPGQKLDMSDPKDRAMAPVWSDIYKKVVAQFLNDTIQWTYQHPTVTTNVASAADASQYAGEKLAAAAVSQAKANEAAAAQKPDEHAQHAAEAQQHLADAHDAHVDAGAHAKIAASVQPATASPELVHHAAHMIQDFTMNGAGQGVAMGPPHPDDAVAAMQGAQAGAHTAEIANGAPPAQTAPSADSGIPTYPATPAELGAKKSGGGKQRPVLGLAIAGVAAIGLGIFGYAQHSHAAAHRAYLRRQPRRLSR